jgi:hypothetical protein
MKQLADFTQADMEKTIRHNSATGKVACVVKGYDSTGLSIPVQYSSVERATGHQPIRLRCNHQRLACRSNLALPF